MKRYEIDSMLCYPIQVVAIPERRVKMVRCAWFIPLSTSQVMQQADVTPASAHTKPFFRSTLFHRSTSRVVFPPIKRRVFYFGVWMRYTTGFPFRSYTRTKIPASTKACMHMSRYLFSLTLPSVNPPMAKSRMEPSKIHCPSLS